MLQNSTESDQLIVLKSRLFDALEDSERYKKLAEQYSIALAQVAENFGIRGEQIQLTEIVAASEKFKQDE
ncbi:hypothetical protein [Pantoea sp. MBLJ3]|uniref:hypothetical protein n=1 Tax=Pantoea sp. MBLJ3 TaxID=1562889 RepID=UPI00057E8C0F|nr:hypothetical protein [Pantoea sp. MBLJ3]